MKTKSFIGLSYSPIDNSYEVNLTKSYADKKYLAGTSMGGRCLTTIESEPFDVPIISPYGNKEVRVHKMVVVSFEDNTYITMFHEWGVRQEEVAKTADALINALNKED